ERETRPLRDNRFAIISALVGRYSLTFSSSRKTGAGVGVSETPAGHRWDSSPKIRFVPDSTLEGAGFEPSVPLEVLTVSGSSLVVSADFPRFPPENEVRSGLGAGGRVDSNLRFPNR